MSSTLGRYAVTVLLLATGLALVLSQAQPPILQSVNAPRTTEPREKQTPTNTTELGSTATTDITTTTTTQSLTIYVTQLNTGVSTTTALASSSITETTAVTAPIQIGPLSLDLADAGGLRFLAFTGAVALAGFICGALVVRLGPGQVFLTKKHFARPPEEERPLSNDKKQEDVEGVFVRSVPTAEGSEPHTDYGELPTAFSLGEYTDGDPNIKPLDSNESRRRSKHASD